MLRTTPRKAVIKAGHEQKDVGSDCARQKKKKKKGKRVADSLGP